MEIFLERWRQLRKPSERAENPAAEPKTGIQQQQQSLHDDAAQLPESHHGL